MRGDGEGFFGTGGTHDNGELEIASDGDDGVGIGVGGEACGGGFEEVNTGWYVEEGEGAGGGCGGAAKDAVGVGERDGRGGDGGAADVGDGAGNQADGHCSAEGERAREDAVLKWHLCHGSSGEVQAEGDRCDRGCERGLKKSLRQGDELRCGSLFRSECWP